MKLSGRKVTDFLNQAQLSAKSVLIFGPDSGLVRERAKILAAKCVDDLSDPFSVTEFSGAQLKSDPAALADAALSLSMMGGRSVVLVRDGLDAMADDLADLLDRKTEIWPIIIEAGDLSPRSKLRALYEKRKDTAAMACYPEEGRALEAFIKEYMAGEGLNVSPGAVQALSMVLAGNRMLVRREIEKLSLYVQTKESDNTRVSEDDVLACIGDSAESSLDDLVFAVGSGNQVAVDRSLAKAFQEGVNPVGAIRAVQRHFQRLHFVHGVMADGASLDQAMNGLRPPVFFKRKDEFQRQARQWTARHLEQALMMASENEIDSKTTGMPAEILCGRTLMRIAQAARRR